MLLFLDNNKRFEGSAIDERARCWAANSDEYLCWDFAPKEALVVFVPCDKMTDTPKAPDESFFRPEFRTSRSLGSFRNGVPRPLSIDNYIRRVRLLLLVMLDGLFPDINEYEFLIDHLVENLNDPLPWGYALNVDKLVLRERMVASIGSMVWNDNSPSALEFR